MSRPHRRSLLWQSVCILLPLFLLAGLAVWHLFDARKVAMEEARATASDLAFRLSERLEDEFVELRARSYKHINVDELDDFFYPLAPTPAGESELYSKYLEAADDKVALAELIPMLSEARTPAGLPLKPLAQFRMVQLCDYGKAELEALSRSVFDHPSILSESLLNQAHYRHYEEGGDHYAQQNMTISGALQHWGLQENLRDILRPYRDAPPRESFWADGELGPLWISLQNGDLCPVAPGNLTPMIDRVLAEAAERHPPYIGADVYVGNRKLSSSRASVGKPRVEWDLGGERSGFISVENVWRGPFQIESFISDTAPLYAQVRAQTYWYAAVIALSTLAALLGLLALRRSYARQLELSEMKSNFVASVSHELRAPVASVRLLAERLRSGKVADEDKRDEYYGFIEGETRRLGTLVENILDFSRIERGQKDYHFADTDIAELLRDTARTMQHYADERGVKLIIELADEELHAEADAEELRQAVVNLIDNAIKFSPKEAIVTVGADAKQKTARIWVADAGPGVPKAEREKIFERFYRSGSELTREIQGAGIGLSIVQHIATGHRGEITLDCPPAGGSRFTLSFPTHQNHA